MERSRYFRAHLGVGAIILLAITLVMCAKSRDLVGIDITPTSQVLNTAGETVQYSAVGRFNRAPFRKDITAQVKWSSSDVGVASISSAGLATATGLGQTTIVASSTDGPDNSEIDVQASLSVGGSLPTLTVRKTGTGTGLVTSSPVGINCGSTCSAQFVLGTTVTLTADPAGASTFGGWDGCDSTSGNLCEVTVNSDVRITATFN